MVRNKKFLYKNKHIINLWNNDPSQTLLSVGSLFNMSRERIRQIEEAALRKLRFWIKKYKMK